MRYNVNHTHKINKQVESQRIALVSNSFKALRL